MGRNAKPVELLVLEGKTHITQKEIARRKAAEIKLGSHKITADPQVMADERALKEFRFLKKLYGDIPFVGTLDSHIVNQYCMSVAELDDLVAALSAARAKMREDTSSKYLNLVLSLDSEIRLKRGELVKLSDRLYLNPVARTKNLPKKEERPKRDPKDDLFGDTG